MSYDTWKTRSDTPEDEMEPDEAEEAELTIYDAEQAFAVLIDWYGYERAKEIMQTIVRNAEGK